MSGTCKRCGSDVMVMDNTGLCTLCEEQLKQIAIMQEKAVENEKKDAEYTEDGMKILATAGALVAGTIVSGIIQSWHEQKMLKEKEKLYFAEELILTMPKECRDDTLLREKQLLINKLEETKNRCYNIELIANNKTRDKKFYLTFAILFYIYIFLFYCVLMILGIFIPGIIDFYPMRLIPAILTCFMFYAKIKFSNKAYIIEDAKHLIHTDEYIFIKNEIQNISNNIADFSDISLIKKTKEKLHYFKCCLLNDKNAQITKNTHFVSHKTLKFRALEFTIIFSWFIPANWIFSWWIILFIPIFVCFYKAVEFLNPVPTFPTKIDCGQYINNSDNIPQSHAATTCPHCKEQFEIEADWDGMEAECPICNRSFIIEVGKQ